MDTSPSPSAARVAPSPRSNARANPTSRAAAPPSALVAFAHHAAVPLIPDPSPTPAASTTARAANRAASTRRANRSIAFTSAPVTLTVATSRHACNATTASTAAPIRPDTVHGDEDSDSNSCATMHQFYSNKRSSQHGELPCG